MGNSLLITFIGSTSFIPNNCLPMLRKHGQEMWFNSATVESLNKYYEIRKTKWKIVHQVRWIVDTGGLYQNFDWLECIFDQAVVVRVSHVCRRFWGTDMCCGIRNKHKNPPLPPQQYYFILIEYSQTCLERTPWMPWKSGLSRQVVVADRVSLHGLQWQIGIFTNWRMVSPERVVFPEKVVPDRFHCIIL